MFKRLARFIRPISSSMQPAVAALQVEAWQRKKVASFSEDLEQLLLRHKAGGLDQRRIARAVTVVAKAFEKLAA